MSRDKPSSPKALLIAALIVGPPLPIYVIWLTTHTLIHGFDPFFIPSIVCYAIPCGVPVSIFLFQWARGKELPDSHRPWAWALFVLNALPAGLSLLFIAFTMLVSPIVYYLQK